MSGLNSVEPPFYSCAKESMDQGKQKNVSLIGTLDPEQQIRNAKTPEVFRSPPEWFPSTLLPPRHPAKKQTDFTKDPLWLEGGRIDGEVGLFKRKAVQEFNAEVAKYPEWVSKSSKRSTKVDKNFPRGVSLRTYTYYHPKTTTRT